MEMVRNRALAFVIITAFFARIALFFYDKVVWWDGAVYVQMGKCIFSGGSYGLIEPIRPLLLPIVLGFFSWLGLNPVLFGRVFEIAASLASIYVFYLISEELFDKKRAVIAALVFSFVPAFFLFSIRLYTGIPSLFFSLVSVYFFIKQRLFFSGLFVGLSFATRFPQGMLLVGLGLSMLASNRRIDKDRIKELFMFLSGFLAVLVAYLALNYLLYENPFEAFVQAHSIIEDIDVWYFEHPWHYYFAEFFRQNPLLYLSFPGVFLWLNRFRTKNLFVVMCFLLFFIYFSQLKLKEPRYLIAFLPFALWLALHTLNSIVKNFRTFSLIVGLSLFFSFYFILRTPLIYNHEVWRDYFNRQDLDGKSIITSNPAVGLTAKAKLFPLYYFDYVNNKERLLEEIKSHDYVFFSNCDFPCSKNNLECFKERAALLDFVSENTDVVYEKEGPNCNYSIFKP